MKSLKTILVCGAAALASALAACGGGGGSTPSQPISVSLGTVPSTLAAGATNSLSATVANDPSGAGVTWSVSCGSSACGSFNPSSTASGAATTFQAPAAVPSGNNVTVVATSVTDTTKTASASITITPPSSGINVSFATAPPSTVTVSSVTNVTANVTGDTKNGGVTWTVSCGSPSCGTFAPASTASGVPTAYTAPAAVPTGNTVKIVATSVTDTTVSTSATITVANAALADGTYIFNLAGTSSAVSGGSPYYAAGAFIVLNGSISGGELDYNEFGSEENNVAIVSAGSSIGVTADGNLGVTLATNDQNLGVAGAITLRGALSSALHGQITEFDSFAAATGTLDLQASTAALGGGYVFALNGYDGTGQPANQVIGGVLSFSGGNLAIAGSVYDYNDGGTFGQAQGFTSGSVTAPDSFGRVTITLTPVTNAVIDPFIVGGYIIDGGRIALVENTDTLGATMGGLALSQGSNAGNFTATSVNGNVYVFSALGGDSNTGGSATFGGGFALTATGGSGGTASGDLAIADLNCCGDDTFNGTWTIDPTGRVTLNTGKTITNGNGPFNFQIYLVGNGNAVVIGVDTQQATEGQLYQQTSGAVNAGNYSMGATGFVSDSGGNLYQWSAAGPIALSSGGSLSGFADYNLVLFPPPVANVALSGTFNSTNGFTIIGLDPSNSNGDAYGYWPIDGNRTIGVELDQNQLGLFLIEMTGQ